MSLGEQPSDSAADRAAERLSAAISYMLGAWRALDRERRLAVIACCGLFVSLFLPWYQETAIVPGRGHRLQAASESLSALGAFSIAEALVLLVAVGVSALLIHRAHAARQPAEAIGVTAAGALALVAVIVRMLTQEGTHSHGHYATNTGIQFGIFLAAVFAVLLTYAGTRMRTATGPRPAATGPRPAATGPRPAATGPRAASTPAGATRAGSAQRAGAPTAAAERKLGWLSAPPGHAQGPSAGGEPPEQPPSSP
jgi:uncharacterized membrane protein YhaH (DUF805 family)